MSSPPAPRRAKIVCTIGPASAAPETLRAMIAAGMDVARLNFSDGTHESHGEAIRHIGALSADFDRPVGILLDLQGPRIRTGVLRGGRAVTLEPGRRITITTDPIEGDASRISTTYADLARDVKPGMTILIADGLLQWLRGWRTTIRQHA